MQLGGWACEGAISEEDGAVIGFLSDASSVPLLTVYKRLRLSSAQHTAGLPP